MKTLHSLLVYSHIAAGAIALVLFWIPALARKGSRLHVGAGKIYVVTMYAVSITAFVASVMVLADPLGIRVPGEDLTPERADALTMRFRTFSLFLLMLSILVLTSLRHGIVALRERMRPGSLAHPSHRALILSLGGLALTVGVIGLLNGQLLLVIFAAIGVTGATGMYRDSRKRSPGPRDLVTAHFNGLIGSGIGAYTAFFAFGGSRLLGDLLPGQWQVIPWVLPAIIGTVMIRRLERRDARRARGRAAEPGKTQVQSA
jgi:uncharacterized membrane protein